MCWDTLGSIQLIFHGSGQWNMPRSVIQWPPKSLVSPPWAQKPHFISQKCPWEQRYHQFHPFETPWVRTSPPCDGREIETWLKPYQTFPKSPVLALWGTKVVDGSKGPDSFDGPIGKQLGKDELRFRASKQGHQKVQEGQGRQALQQRGSEEPWTMTSRFFTTLLRQQTLGHHTSLAILNCEQLHLDTCTMQGGSPMPTGSWGFTSALKTLRRIWWSWSTSWLKSISWLGLTLWRSPASLTFRRSFAALLATWRSFSCPRQLLCSPPWERPIDHVDGQGKPSLEGPGSQHHPRNQEAR